jgi:hexosaminidase
MLRTIIIMLICCLNMPSIRAQQNVYPIIPRPTTVHGRAGGFVLDNQTRLFASTEEGRKNLKLFAGQLWSRYHIRLSMAKNGSGKCIRIENNGTTMRNDAYTLSIDQKAIQITGSGSGTFYALQSLLQLVQQNKNGLYIPAATITDKPGFSYRGIMLDAARHFLPLNEMKKIIDLMAYYKLNKLQWHLTDDQGWRLEIKKYPRLTQVSAFRDSTIIGHYGDFKPLIYDGQRHGGFYTQDDVRSIVKYAADRKVTIIPEIELPGHSTAALAAYPEFGCKDTTYQVPGYWGVHPNIYCPKEETFKFLEDVFTEVMDLFPGEFIHIGGDEAPKDHWKASALAQSIIKDQHLKDEHALQGYFVSRIEKFLNKHGRRLVGWDEILEGGVAPSATIMSWRGERGGIKGAKMGHDVIMTPNSYLYADRYQSQDKASEPTALGGFVSLEKLYSYNPRPDVLSVQEKQHILGVQANMWTEYVSTTNKLEYMLFPRMLALSEIAWSGREQQDYDDFSVVRLPVHLRELEKLNVFFRIPEAKINFGTDRTTGRKTVEIIPFVANSTIYYTVDNHKADQTATVYKGPVQLPHPGKTLLNLNYIIVTPGARASNMFSVPLTP